MNRISCWARRACSSGVNGAAVKWSSSASARRTAPGTRSGVAAKSGQGGELGVGGLALGRAALLLVFGRQHQPVAGGDRQGLGDRRLVAALALGRGLVEVLDQARLVGVEEVLADLRRRVGGGEVARREPIERRRRVDARPREPGRLAEVADQQPFAGALGIVAPGVGERDLVGAAVQGSDGGSVGGCEGDRIRIGDGGIGRRQGAAEIAQLGGREAPEAVLERAAERCPRSARGALGGAAVEQQLAAGVEQRRTDLLRRGPRLRGRVAPVTPAPSGMGARRKHDEGRDDERRGLHDRCLRPASPFTSRRPGARSRAAVRPASPGRRSARRGTGPRSRACRRPRR